jgi:hypothetical protein
MGQQQLRATQVTILMAVIRCQNSGKSNPVADKDTNIKMNIKSITSKGTLLASSRNVHNSSK